MSEIMVRERFLRSGKKVYEYSFEMASVDGKRKRKSKSGFVSKRDARIAGRKALSEYENVGQVMVDRIFHMLIFWIYGWKMIVN